MNFFKVVSLCILFSSSSMFGQFTIVNTSKVVSSGNHENTPALDTIFIVQNLDNVSINYTHTDSTDFSWSKIRIENGLIQAPQLILSSISSNSINSSISIDEACGYEIEIGSTGNTIKKYVWILNYEEILPKLDSVVVYDDRAHFADSCSTIIVSAFRSSDSVVVGDFLNNRIVKLTRFQRIEWSAEPQLNMSSKEFTIELNAPNIPYEDTKFKATLWESFFEGVPNFNSKVEKDTLYMPVAVKIEKILARIITRENNNELEKESNPDIKGSAPLNVNFSTEGTNSKVAYYDWEILANAEGDSQKITFALDSFRYEFRNDINDTEIADYYTRVTVSNDFCMAKANDEVKIVSSYLDAANILILGFNTETEAQQFKVAYKSIRPESFRGAIYNRWGRRIFTWTDPELGWDGRFNGKYVSPGVYYYVILATGTDGEKWRIKRDLNVLREKGLK